MVDPAAVDYSIPGYDNPDGSERGRIRVPTYSAWTMEAGSDTVEVPLVNTEGNPCYMKFAVKLKDSGEVLYESGLVPPGKAVPEIRLNRPLEAGTYPVAVEISTFSLDDPEQPLNGAQMGTGSRHRRALPGARFLPTFRLDILPVSRFDEHQGATPRLARGFPIPGPWLPSCRPSGSWDGAHPGQPECFT